MKIFDLGYTVRRDKRDVFVFFFDRTRALGQADATPRGTIRPEHQHPYSQRDLLSEKLVTKHPVFV